MNFKPVLCWEAAWYNICHNTHSLTLAHTMHTVMQGETKSRTTGVFYVAVNEAPSFPHYSSHPQTLIFSPFFPLLCLFDHVGLFFICHIFPFLSWCLKKSVF